MGAVAAVALFAPEQAWNPNSGKFLERVGAVAVFHSVLRKGGFDLLGKFHGLRDEEFFPGTARGGDGRQEEANPGEDRQKGFGSSMGFPGAFEGQGRPARKNCQKWDGDHQQRKADQRGDDASQAEEPDDSTNDNDGCRGEADFHSAG